MANLKKLPVVFYATYRGNEPVRERLKKLDAESRQIVGKNIATAEFGWPGGMPLCRDMGKGLHEVCSPITNGRIARVLLLPIAGEMVLLHGFIKKTQKTPKSDLDLGHQTNGRVHVMSRRNPNRGSSFSDFLKEEGTCEETTAIAVKRVLAWQLKQAMEKEHLSKNQMAKRMKTSRSQLDRILDPDNPKIQLDTIMKAASVLGREVRLELT